MLAKILIGRHVSTVAKFYLLLSKTLLNIPCHPILNFLAILLLVTNNDLSLNGV